MRDRSRKPRRRSLTNDDSGAQGAERGFFQRIIDWKLTGHHIFAAIVLALLGGGGAWLWDRFGSKVYDFVLNDPHAQKVRWLAAQDKVLSGIELLHEAGSAENVDGFLRWSALNTELETQLLPQIFKNPSGYRFEVRDFHGKKNWIIEIRDFDGKSVANLWLGHDPASRWAFDGLVRIGGDIPTAVWQRYQRYSNGTYRRLPSDVSALELACPPASRPCVNNDR